MLLDKTKNHFHIELKFIYQPNNNFNPGRFVGILSSGEYILSSISTDPNSPNTYVNVQGVVWSIIENKGFYLMTSSVPLYYRHPLGPEYYNTTIDGKINENDSLIPGNFGDTLYLGQNGLPSIDVSEFIVGYRTKNGMMFRPEYNTCYLP